MSQAALADAVGLGRVSITNIELGNQNPPVATMQAIGEALGYELTLAPVGDPDGSLERGLDTARRRAAVETLLAMRWRWDGEQWMPPR